MEARVLTLILLASTVASLGAKYRSENFIVTASTEEVARAVAETAEECRSRLAVEWTGEEMRPWYYPCPITVKDGAMGAGGWTKFTFIPHQGEIHVNNWDMKVQGSLERILDSVIPHEVTHTILATHFRRPLPRWADEGASTLAEHESERRRQVNTLKQVLQAKQTIPLRQLLDMKDYPSDMQKVYTLYAQGYSLAELLVQQGGRGKFLRFLETAHRKTWDDALMKLYGYRSISDLETRWKEWVMAGSPDLTAKNETRASRELPLAQESPSRRNSSSRGPLVRSQSPEEDPFLGPEAISVTDPQALADPALAPAEKEVAAPELERVAMVERPMDTDSASTEEPARLPSYAREDQPPAAIPEDDAWDLELIPAVIVEATTRVRDNNAVVREEPAPTVPRPNPAVRSSRTTAESETRPLRPFRRNQSDFPMVPSRNMADISP